MSVVLRRIASTFVLPAEAPAPAFLPPDPPPPDLDGREPAVAAVAPARTGPTARPDRDSDATAPPAACVSVVCPGRDLAVAGAAVGLGLLEAVGGRCAVVVEWTGSDRQPAMARPAGLSARRRAAALVSCGLPAVAGGRIVRVALPADEAEAVRGARDALAAAGAPAVVALGGPRTAALDELVAQQRMTLLATREDGDEDLVDLAAAELAQLGPAVQRLVLPDAPVAAGFARAGVALVSPLRAAVLGCLETLR